MIIGMTRKVKAFLHKLFNSIVPQNTYYAHIIKQRLHPSVVYFLIVLVVSSLLATGVVILQINRNNPGRIGQCLTNSLKSVPDDLSLHVLDGNLSTNQSRPTFLWFNCNNKLALLGVIDERATNGDIFSYNAQMLATATDMVFRYKNYTYTLPYRKYVTELRATKGMLIGYKNTAVNLLAAYYPLLTLLLLIIAPITFFVINSIQLLLSSLAVQLFFRLLKRHYAYRTVLHVGLHSSTLPILTSLLFIIFPVHLTNTLILFFFLIFIFQLVGVYEAHYVEPSSHHK